MPPFADSRGHTGDPTQERHGRALGSRDLRQRGRGLSRGLVLPWPWGTAESLP